jgi:hypothetical protein
MSEWKSKISRCQREVIQVIARGSRPGVGRDPPGLRAGRLFPPFGTTATCGAAVFLHTLSHEQAAAQFKGQLRPARRLAYFDAFISE